MNGRIIIKICAVVCGLGGAVILLWVFFPIISYEFTQSSPLQTFLSPFPVEGNTGGVTNNDYTKVSNWFPEAKKPNDYSIPKVAFYRITIARLGIRNASVTIGGEDLNDSLIQYPGTALPGKLGNAVIFGHSVLPAFFNPTSYLTIFSTLPTLAKNDVIVIDYDGVTYKYQVEDKFEVDPTDIQVLDQNQSDSFLTLVTCVPPGLETRRLIVRARIVPVRST
ncbi:MAG TPA: sortase [Candidatus Saccharimonadales bacterium]|nr:sortase [Candidatus Saccharimonadales bacterium]